MSEEHKIDADELISLYLDGQATQRQKTELKRLMVHDAALLDRLKAMKRQTAVLNALPVETAPAGLLDEIRSEMERKMILDNFADNTKISAATTHLFARRLLTSAAMLLLPLGLLALVVFQIVKRPSAGLVDYQPIDSFVTQVEPLASPELASIGFFSELPFNGVLVLKTDNYSSVNTMVKQAIDQLGLLAQAFPERTVTVTRFHITAPPKQVADLMNSLAAVRPQCQAVALQIPGPEVGAMTEIVDPQAKQIAALLFEDSPQLYERLATRYAAANQKADSVFAKNDEGAPELDETGYPTPSIPTLAGNYDLQNKTVQLTIQVERVMDQ
ncbi:MAG: hypothetical protein H8E62_10620 [Planctomycetes bacterium]|nr:hypothetical protein [Planctomycetota bacterium]